MRRHLLSLFLLLSVLPLAAQTKVSLGTQVQGQLPVPNAQNVVNLVPRLSGNAGLHRGAHASTGYTETFIADGRCTPGSSNATGFDSSTNMDCSLPGFYHAASGTFDIERTLSYGVTNAQPPSPTHLSLTASSTWNNNTIGSIGVSSCPVGSFACGSAHELALTWNSAGLYLLQEGTGTQLWAAGGNGSGKPGTTDSTTGSGWAAPSLGAIYAFSLTLPGDGTVIVSAMPAGSLAGNPCFPANCSFAVRVPVTLPSVSLHSFFVRGGTSDFVSDVTLADGFTIGNGVSTVYDIASDPRAHGPRILRWAVHSNGTECNYAAIAATPDADCTNVFALIPPNYNPNVANPWFLQLRGQENSTLSGGLTTGTTNYVYAVDPAFAGGSPQPVVTTNRNDYLGKQGYILLGQVAA